MSTWLPVVAAAVGAGGASGIIGSLVTGLLSRPKTRADAVSILTDAALRQVNELQEEAAEAKKEAVAARGEAETARQQVRLLNIELDQCWGRLRLWRAAILRDDASLPALRAMVSETELNGR